MTPEKALELVGKYARLNKSIAVKKKEIGRHLDRCNGLSGKRNDPFFSRETDAKNRETDLHLADWYTPTTGESWDSPHWESITADEHGKECPHCYAAHLAIEERKQLRKEFGIVKRSISRATA